MCHDFIAIVLQSSASSVLIVCAPRSARLLKVFSRSSLRNFVKICSGPTGTQTPPVRDGLISYGSQARMLVRLSSALVAAAPFALWLLRERRWPPEEHAPPREIRFLATPQAGHEVNRVCESDCTDLPHQLCLSVHASSINPILCGLEASAPLDVDVPMASTKTASRRTATSRRARPRWRRLPRAPARELGRARAVSDTSMRRPRAIDRADARTALATRDISWR
jgi:hypothetical protein